VENGAWPDRHLLDVDTLTVAQVERIMTLASEMVEARARREPLDALRGRQVVTLFYEPSTRTRVSFEAAARALGAEVLTVTVATSSVTKGESLVDTVRTLEALGTDVLVMRHARSGAPYLAARHFSGSIVNGGDGWHAHPTQALVDLFTLRSRLPVGELAGRKVVIVGDVLRSRVARSNIWTLTGCGADVWLCGPRPLLGRYSDWAAVLPADRRLTVTDDLASALDGADAVMALRMQRERDAGSGLPSSVEYAERYGLTEARLAGASPDVVVLHPGPMNEGVEISPAVADGPRSAILEQVRNGVPVRMAVLALLAGRAGSGRPS
jgi:aspartate carbamoyltransferase catalytic subunit